MNTYDHLQEAIKRLASVHDSMLDALLESQNGPEDQWISSSDFIELNALFDKLNALSARFAPQYHMPSWSDLTDMWSKHEDDTHAD